MTKVFIRMRKPWVTKHKERDIGVGDGGSAAITNPKPLIVKDVIVANPRRYNSGWKECWYAVYRLVHSGSSDDQRLSDC